MPTFFNFGQILLSGPRQPPSCPSYPNARKALRFGVSDCNREDEASEKGTGHFQFASNRCRVRLPNLSKATHQQGRCFQVYTSSRTPNATDLATVLSLVAPYRSCLSASRKSNHTDQITLISHSSNSIWTTGQRKVSGASDRKSSRGHRADAVNRIGAGRSCYTCRAKQMLAG